MAVSVVLIILGVLMFWHTKQFPYGGLTAFGAGFWPRTLAALLIIFSVLLFITSWFSRDPKMNEVVIDWKSIGMKRVYATVGVMVLFCVMIHYFGLLFAIFWMIFSIMFVMGERRKTWLIITPASMTLFIFVAFQLLLHMSLPAGVLFS